MKISKPYDKNGFVLVVCLILLLMLALIGIASITSSTSDMQVSGNELNQTGAFYAAESGLERAAAAIVTSYENSGIPPSPLPSGSVTESSYRYDYFVSDDGAAVQKTLTDGAYKGLYGLVKSFTINSTGADLAGETRVNLELGMQDALIPLFQFAVFYQYDLEIAPGPNMTLGGRVHSNGDIYLQSGNNLYINSNLTSAENIFHGRKAGSGQSESLGNILIKDANGVYQNMNSSDGTWLDSEAPDWVNNSISRWGGNVEDSDHGITELYMPVITDGPPTDLIDRGAGNSDSYENKAGLKFVDGQAYFLQSGNWANVTASLVAQGVIAPATFYDGREGKNVYALDLDIQRLGASGYFPANGIVYASQTTVSGTVSALRLRNCATLPAAMTVATDNPLYTVGNFNTVAKKPAALLSDAMTILSSNWNDGMSQGPLNDRVAISTVVNACYITGNNETGAGGHAYNGGLENLPRFLEKWDGATFTWRGSAVDLWYSRQADGEWSYGNFYTAPNRDWAFDPDLLDINKLPPGTPLVNIVQRTQWKHTFSLIAER